MSDSCLTATKIAYYSPNDDIPKLITIKKPPDQVTLGDFQKEINIRSGLSKFYFKNRVDDVGVVKEHITDPNAILPSSNGHVTCYIEFDHLINNHEHCFDHHHHHHNFFSSQRTDDSCSDFDGTCCDDDDDDTSSRITTTTDETSVSRIRHARRNNNHMSSLSRTSSQTSLSDTTVSTTYVTVELDLNESNFLGMSLVGKANRGGIYVGAIMNGGAVAKDGRIQPGDMILQVNDKIFENMSNDEAVNVIRNVVKNPGRIKIVVAKCFGPDIDSKSYFHIRRDEPVQPIDLQAWVNHTEASRGLNQSEFFNRPPSVGSLTSSSSLRSSFVESEQRQLLIDNRLTQLTREMDMMLIAKCMAKADSDLEIKEREWLKVKIPDAFLGSDAVNWLYTHVQGFKKKKEAEEYAAEMLKMGLIRHTVNKTSFSKKRYYVFDESALESNYDREII